MEGEIGTMIYTPFFLPGFLLSQHIPPSCIAFALAAHRLSKAPRLLSFVFLYDGQETDIAGSAICNITGCLSAPHKNKDKENWPPDDSAPFIHCGRQFRPTVNIKTLSISRYNRGPQNLCLLLSLNGIRVRTREGDMDASHGASLGKRS